MHDQKIEEVVLVPLVIPSYQERCPLEMSNMKGMMKPYLCLELFMFVDLTQNQEVNWPQ